MVGGDGKEVGVSFHEEHTKPGNASESDKATPPPYSGPFAVPNKKQCTTSSMQCIRPP